MLLLTHGPEPCASAIPPLLRDNKDYFSDFSSICQHYFQNFFSFSNNFFEPANYCRIWRSISLSKYVYNCLKALRRSMYVLAAPIVSTALKHMSTIYMISKCAIHATTAIAVHMSSAEVPIRLCSISSCKKSILIRRFSFSSSNSSSDKTSRSNFSMCLIAFLSLFSINNCHSIKPIESASFMYSILSTNTHYNSSFINCPKNKLSESLGTYQFDSLHAMSQIDTSPVTH